MVGCTGIALLLNSKHLNVTFILRSLCQKIIIVLKMAQRDLFQDVNALPTPK